MKQDEDTDQSIGDDESEGKREDTGDSTISSDIEEDDLDHQVQFPLFGQAHWDKSLRNTRVLLTKKLSCANTASARPLLPNSWTPLGSVAPPPLLKHQNSTFLNKSSDSDHAPSAQMLPQPKSSGDQNAPQPKASADQKVSQHQQATFEVAKMFMESIVSTKTPWETSSDDKYSMVEEAWKVAIQAEDGQQALAGAPAGTPSVCQVPSSPTLKINPQTWEAVSFGFCLMLFYQIYDIDYTPNYT